LNNRRDHGSVSLSESKGILLPQQKKEKEIEKPYLDLKKTAFRIKLSQALKVSTIKNT